MKIILSVYGVCDIGCKTPNNEDMLLLGDVIFRDGSMKKEFAITDDADGSGGYNRVVIAVADGVGGLEKGEVASEMALSRLREFLERIPDDLNNKELEEVFDVYAQETHSAMSSGMGSTIAGLFLYRGKVFRFHAGDSRIYLLRNGGLTRLTTDHSLRETGGNLSAPTNIITNALGGPGSAFIEFAEIEQPFSTGNIYLLSSDGLHDLVSSAVISDTLILSQTDKTEAAEKLLALAKEKGGLDNISTITIKVEEKKV